MILEVPFLHTVTGYRPRERTLTSRHFVDFAPVRVREIGGDEAPVVARCRYLTRRPVVGRAKGNAPGRLHGAEAEVEVDYRLLDGRLMRRAVLDVPGFFGHFALNEDARELTADAAKGDAVRAALDGEWVADVTADIAQSAMRLYGWGMSRGSHGPVPRKPGDKAPRHGSLPIGWNDMNRIASDDRRERAAEMARAMAGAAIVDGVLYMPSFGPTWLLRDGRRDGETHVAGAEPEIAHVDGRYMDLARLFPGGDERAVEADCARDLAARGLDGPARIRWSGAIEVDDPAALVLPPEEFALREIADRLLKNDHDEFVLKMRSPAALRALADVLEVWQEPEADPARMVPAFRTLVAEYQARLAPGEGYDWMRAAMEAVLDRVEWRRANAPAAPGSAAPAAGPRI